MKLYLFNTKTRQKELFTPIDPKNIGMYVCGPTVYDHPHIGNARPEVVYDVLFRVLKLIYKEESVNYVRNITDVDDKINKRAKELSISIKELTDKTTENFHHDMAYLNCLSPVVEPRATDNISQMIYIIEKLIDRGHAYVVDGEVFFSVTSYPDYTELSQRDLNEMLVGVRVEVEESKKHPADFVLWKPASPNDDISSIFDSPWGKGRPGWHIECSAMSHRYLGEEFDIHGGGADLIFPHHTNEIAQSCGAFPGSKFANYWVHNGFLTVNGEKMSKSLGNFITVRDLINKSVPGEVIRYLLLATHYRKPLDYNDKALYDAKEFINYLYRTIENAGIKSNAIIHNADLPKSFIEPLLDDLNTHQCFVYLHELAKAINKEANSEERLNKAHELIKCANFLGFLSQTPDSWFKADVDQDFILNKIKERETAKQTKNWNLADSIRAELLAKGIILEDKPSGLTHWRKE
ncbi:MAG: cysteine--tRNA ligase [Rickettsiaceae bacterium]|jgi:cysteinyl-tRNA synthetase|nr:cysteine--tRNA ligase [Rickettsiaceae bacterium]